MSTSEAYRRFRRRLLVTMTMLALGIIGGYVWRMFENTKGRPLYIPMLHEHFPDKGAP